MKTPSLEIIIYTPQELNQCSYFHTGLFELEGRGEIRCKVVWDISTRRGRLDTQNGKVVYTNHTQPKTSLYKLIDHDTKCEIRFALDMYDVPWYFSKHALENCDFIFKRNFEFKYIMPLDLQYKKKIFSTGLTFGSISNYRHGGIKFYLALLLGNLRITIKNERMMLYKIWKNLNENHSHWVFTSKARKIFDFNKYTPLEITLRHRILFQTRCFPDYLDSDAFAIHEQRAELIRLLRSHFGNKFMGGFVPEEISKSFYHDLITNMPTDPDGYLKMVKESQLCIYTRGLAYSPAWKMAEYLSQGKCIVAEHLTSELPEPLEHGTHLMYFNSPEECVEICKWLLQHPEKMRELGHNARLYYEQHVDPVVNVRRIIHRMLNQKTSI